MPAAALEVEIINKVTNIGAFAEEKAALSGALGGGFTPLGGGNVNFGGSLTANEQRTAAAQMAEYEAKTKLATTAEKDFVTEGNAVARAATAAGIASGDAAGRFLALGGVLGQSGALGLGVGAAIIGLGAVYELGKSMVDNADRNEASQRGLAQAFDSQGQSLRAHSADINTFIEQNARYVSSEYDVEDAFAAGIRSGLDYQTTQRLVNDALDLSIAKNIGLGVAMDDLIKLRTGKASQEFAALGIQIKGAIDPEKDLEKATKELTKAQDEKSKADRALQEEEQRLHDKRNVTQNDLMHLQDLQDKDAAAAKNLADAQQGAATAQATLTDKGNLYAQQLDQVEGKVKGARKNQSDLKQASHELGLTWQRLSDDNGPALEGMLTTVIGKTDDFLNMLRNSGPVWNQVDGFLTGFIGKWQGATTAIDNATISFGNWLRETTGADPNTPLGGFGGRPWDKYGPGNISTNDRQRGFGGALA